MCLAFFFVPARLGLLGLVVGAYLSKYIAKCLPGATLPPTQLYDRASEDLPVATLRGLREYK